MDPVTSSGGAAVRRLAGAGRRGVGPRPHPTARSLTTTVAAALAALLLLAPPARAQGDVPELTRPVNDFARIIDEAHARTMDGMIRALQQATGDAVVVATIPTFEPYADIREYAVRMFENRGKGVGHKDKHNGLLVLLAVKERKVWIEVGYGLEEFITDGYAGETSREWMIPAFRAGDYSGGLSQGVERIIGRIAEGRQVKLSGVSPPAPARTRRSTGGLPGWAIVVIVIIALVAAATGRGGPSIGGRGYRRGGLGGAGWSGWSSGIGSFGGSGGGGFGGGFSGFGGGGSGGGGGGGSW